MLGRGSKGIINMAKFFEGRNQIGSSFYLPAKSKKERILCTAFSRWVDTNQGVTLHCGRTASVEISKTVGLDEKKSETMEASIGSTLGVTGLAQLKSQMKNIVGTEIQWNQATTTKFTLPCKAPLCGRYELAVFQLIREYEFACYSRGRWPFSHDVWDLKEKPTIIPEYTEIYDLLDDEFEFDERCTERCGAPATTPDYEGRVCVDFGDVSLNVPYKASAKTFTIRIGPEDVSIAGLTSKQVEYEAQLDFSVAIIPKVVRFLGDFKTDTVRATISFASRFSPASPIIDYATVDEVKRDEEVQRDYEVNS